jgi:hypothetical protein
MKRITRKEGFHGTHCADEAALTLANVARPKESSGVPTGCGRKFLLLTIFASASCFVLTMRSFQALRLESLLSS